MQTNPRTRTLTRMCKHSPTSTSKNACTQSIGTSSEIELGHLKPLGERNIMGRFTQTHTRGNQQSYRSCLLAKQVQQNLHQVSVAGNESDADKFITSKSPIHSLDGGHQLHHPKISFDMDHNGNFVSVRQIFSRLTNFTDLSVELSSGLEPRELRKFCSSVSTNKASKLEDFRSGANQLNHTQESAANQGSLHHKLCSHSRIYRTVNCLAIFYILNLIVSPITQDLKQLGKTLDLAHKKSCQGLITFALADNSSRIHENGRSVKPDSFASNWPTIKSDNFNPSAELRQYINTYDDSTSSQKHQIFTEINHRNKNFEITRKQQKHLSAEVFKSIELAKNEQQGNLYHRLHLNSHASQRPGPSKHHRVNTHSQQYRRQFLYENQDQSNTKKHNRRHRRNHAQGAYFEQGADRPVVATSKGLVRGVTQKIFTGKFVDAFLGIPYAQPPINQYRFRHPVPNNPWQGEYDAGSLSNSCYQVNDTFFGANFMGTSVWNANTPLSEDCLYLNIWAPFGIANTTLPSSSSSTRTSYVNPEGGGRPMEKRPVLVWIFGGGFYSGTASLAVYEGGLLASEEDLVVVSMNYRVSALGFLYFGRPDAPGNAGLFDQLLALQWINDNIAQFGGDPNRVTIFGESAGAVSVSFHLLSPLSRNLFNQAILQSGAATCPWASMDTHEIIRNGLQLASLVNCPSNKSDMDTVISCLLKADPMALVSQEVDTSKSILNFPFVPVVDGSFLLEPPHESLSKSNFKPARILLGSNHDEGNAFLIYLSEFSQCPQQNGADSPTSTTTLPPSINLDSSSITTTDPSVDSYRDQENPPLESLDLLVSAPMTQPLHRVAVEPGNFGDAARHQQQQHRQHQQKKQQQQQQQQQQPINISDQPKPCKPNDFPALSREDFIRVLRDDLNPFADHPIAREAIIFEYSNWNSPQEDASNYDALDKIVGDYYFTCHVNEFANRYASAGNAVYMYYFKHRSTLSPWPRWMGVLHGDEISFIFGEPLNPMYNFTAKEIDLSRRMMRYWADFARYGNPTKSTENDTTSKQWPEYAGKRQYFELNVEYTRLGRGPRSRQCAFWSHHVPKLVEIHDRNQCPASVKPLLNHPMPSPINIPAPVFISLSIFLVLILISLLVVYAKRGRRLFSFNLSSSRNNSD